MIRDLFGNTKAEISIKRLKLFEPPEGYYVAFSGGKDSIVIKQLCIDAGVKYDVHYGLTTIDPPELVRYIKEQHPDVHWERPKKPFLTEVIKNGMPGIHSKWCCKLYKEQGGSGRLVVTGIRWEESARRKNSWKMIQVGRMDKTKRFLNVIVDWTKNDVWDYIREKDLPYCKLYDEGWKRIGCLFCPNDSHKHKLFLAEKYPRFAKAFMKAFQRCKDDRESKGNDTKKKWKDGEDMFNWYIGKCNEREDEYCSLFM